MEINYKYTPAGIILCIYEWDWKTGEGRWEYYHLFEGGCNGPFIDYCFIGNVIEFEIENDIFIKFDSEKRIWTNSNPKESLILQWEEVDRINECLTTYYAFNGPPANA